MFNINTTTITPHHKLLIALSGGIDSCVLLHYFANSPYRQQLRAIHINHQLQTNAQAMQTHCQQLCDCWQIPLITKTITIQTNPGDSLEAVARDNRYQAICEHVDSNTFVLTGQHADDQAETLLLQLLRGAGVAGLAAMPAFKPFANGLLWRPLLSINRLAIEAYAKAHDVSWVEDPSNSDTAFMRNFIRRAVLPIISKRLPVATDTIARSAAHCAEAAELLQEIAAEDLQQVRVQKHQLHNVALQKLSLARQKNVLRYWLKQEADITPSAHLLQRILALPNSSQQAVPMLELGAWRLSVYRHRYYLWQPQLQQEYAYDWDGRTALIIPGYGALSPLPQTNVQTYTVRNRRPGDKLYVAEQNFHKPLKHAFQERGIPPWQRDYWPLIIAEEKVIAIAS